MSEFYQSPRWSAEIADCSMPMTFDTYSNCSYGCMYCFSQFQRGIGGAKDAYLHKEVHPVNVQRIKNMFTDPDKYAGQFAPYIKARKVMQWGGSRMSSTISSANLVRVSSCLNSSRILTTLSASQPRQPGLLRTTGIWT